MPILDSVLQVRDVGSTSLGGRALICPSGASMMPVGMIKVRTRIYENLVVRLSCTACSLETVTTSGCLYLSEVTTRTDLFDCRNWPKKGSQQCKCRRYDVKCDFLDTTNHRF